MYSCVNMCLLTWFLAYLDEPVWSNDHLLGAYKFGEVFPDCGSSSLDDHHMRCWRSSASASKCVFVCFCVLVKMCDRTIFMCAPTIACVKPLHRLSRRFVRKFPRYRGSTAFDSACTGYQTRWRFLHCDRAPVLLIAQSYTTRSVTEFGCLGRSTGPII